MRTTPLALAALALAVGLTSLSGSARAGDVYALTEDDRLVRFDDAIPGTLDGDVVITGLATGETLIALDVHPCDGRVFALSDQDRVVTIDPDTGAASVSSSLSSALGETVVGASFDPESLEWRVVDESDGNRLIDVDTGAVTAQTDLQYDVLRPDSGRDPFVSAIAFVDGGLVGIDTDIDELVAIDPAAGGTLRRIGRLGIDAAAPVGLDHRSGDGALFASVNVGGVSGLYAIDPATGHIRFLGTIGDGTAVIDVAAAAVPSVALAMDKLDLKLNFKKAGKDMIHVRGKIPVPDGDLAGLAAAVDVGGATQTFTLEQNGKGTTGGDTFHLEGQPQDGLIRYDVKLKKGTFGDDFADEGMDGTEDAKKAERQVLVVIELDGVTYASEATVIYTAKVGKTGQAKLDSTTSGSVPPEGCEPVARPPGEPAYEIEIRGNKNTVTLEVGTPGASPFEVRENNSSVTVIVPDDMPIEIVVSGNKNTVEIPAEVASDTTVVDSGNNNTIDGLD